MDLWQSSHQSTATGEENQQSTGMPAEVTAWGDAYTAKRQSLKPSTIPATPGTIKLEQLDPATYKVKLTRFNNNLPTIQAQVDAYNVA